MIGRRFDQATEADLARQYLDALEPSRARSIEPHLRAMRQEVRSIRRGDSVLHHAHSALWIRDWMQGPAAMLKPTTREYRIVRLREWWSWLFDQGVLDDNVLACFRSAADALADADRPLVLRLNLQRPIATFLKERGPGPALESKHVLFALRHFNVTLNRRCGAGNTSPIDEALVRGWLLDLYAGRTIGTVLLAAGHVTSFLDFLVETGRLRENPLGVLWARYRGYPRRSIVETLLGIASNPLTPRPAPKRFVGPLALQLEQFLALKRAMGRKYDHVEEDLQRFDRFTAERSVDSRLSRELVEDWLRAGHALHPRTKKRRVGLVRQFALYLIRLDPTTYVPDRKLWPARIPKFRAHIFSDDEYRALLRAALDLPSPRSPLRPRALFALLLVLYSTGIRVGEASRLKLRDVDLEARTLLVAETKFFKSRLVPFSEELATHLASYLEIRNRFAPSTAESAFFINNRRRSFAGSTIANTFHRLLAAAGVPRRPTTQRPRVHDIRHSFACSRVLRWYRDGADLAAKLPLLATYMGHVSVLSTQTYLNSTPEILGEASRRFEAAYGAVLVGSPGGET